MIRHRLSLAIVLVTCWTRLALAADSPNQLTAAQQAAGWRLLFDGQTTQGWRSFKKPTFPERGWSVADGCLVHTANGGGGDIITAAEFGDFELEFEWNLAADGNSGLKYFVTEQRSSPLGHEYQIIDDALNEDAKNGRQRQTASFYDVLPVAEGVRAHPPGQWNQSKILVRGKQVEHWLNDRLALAYVLDSEELRVALAKSKFKDTAGFGTRIKGHLLLQDHGGEVRFRNLRLREWPTQ